LVEGSGLRVQGSGFRVQGSGFRVQGSGFRVQGSGFLVQGSGFGDDGECYIIKMGFLDAGCQVSMSGVEGLGFSDQERIRVSGVRV